ncbi:hypothetical protein BT96DRAFT_946545 [Gymnopus androsaceus JB14]|uniref:F-box domain-containing protein n=1 Tax=Gymnopus androsaceus JB14 TaxID=1447944 RepID=A0A6A4GVL1_9AGAR|nr:hypothetical protein BT96DRAFT_946545 [Gymnopus androsaceus JB14]
MRRSEQYRKDTWAKYKQESNRRTYVMYRGLEVCPNSLCLFPWTKPNEFHRSHDTIILVTQIIGERYRSGSFNFLLHLEPSPTMPSEPISLLDFPNELLYKIIDLLEPLDVQMLSIFVSKLGPLIDPTLYATVEIKLFNDSIRFICNENLVIPTKSQLQYTRSLFITTDQPYYPDNKLGPTKQWKDRINLLALFGHKAKKAEKPLSNLRDVILSLDKVTFVRWTLPYVGPALGDSFPNGTGLNFDSILKLLAGLPSLDTFTSHSTYTTFIRFICRRIPDLDLRIFMV